MGLHAPSPSQVQFRRVNSYLTQTVGCIVMPLMAAEDVHYLVSMLQNCKYNRGECLAALKGQAVPDALGLKLAQLCAIRGIRYHPGFGHQLRGLLPEFTRALNARSIMSNMIPDMITVEEEPYCIWHPEVASESTCRDLALRYPSMAYQVGRACAVAGYTELYKELEILPEVHIAEEARDSGSQAIFQSIMAAPVKYKIMDDYGRTISLNGPVAVNVNGDTAVRWMLDMKQKFRNLPDEDDLDNWDVTDFVENGFDEQMFNITEDMNIDSVGTPPEDIEKLRPQSDLLALLVEPLPQDLPTADKDCLICAAAYYGNTDRYARLRRPKFVRKEIECLMRGVYHNTLFAVWWSKQKLPQEPKVRMAIEARFIMNNVLSRVNCDDFVPPYLIWFPTFAKPATYRALAQLRPDMLPQILRACIVAGPGLHAYKEVFDELVHLAIPDEALIREAERTGDAHYKQALLSRVAEVGLVKLPWPHDWKLYPQQCLQTSSDQMTKYNYQITPGGSFEMLYNGNQCDAGEMELMACLPEAWKIGDDDMSFWKELDYVTWPPSLTSVSTDHRVQK
ncbi:hypothetical protein DOTSEDRAFT_43352 [Dothistroma septosporum NZE10]|uniref:Uncharacterized protein n=1 Tax=Dothistroma septosporum (strain NZE10 / CBS 128990) TaxID=675120 RepID=N1PRB6_DOTSN|nr:hypothetical protein DOTSEDRAFT_43352 [Dothistroma septosporum NZE10]